MLILLGTDKKQEEVSPYDEIIPNPPLLLLLQQLNYYRSKELTRS